MTEEKIIEILRKSGISLGEGQCCTIVCLYECDYPKAAKAIMALQEPPQLLSSHLNEEGVIQIIMNCRRTDYIMSNIDFKFLNLGGSESCWNERELKKLDLNELWQLYYEAIT